MNVAELREAVYDRLGVGPDDPNFRAPVVMRQIAAAVHYVEAEHDWPWLGRVVTFDTVVGTGSYDPPGDWARTKSLRVAGRRDRLVRLDVDELEDRFGDEERGEPRAWAVFGEKLLLRPVPSEVLTVRHRYFAAEPEPANDDAVPLLPARFHPAIAEVAAWFCLKRSDEDGRAVVARAAWEDWRTRMLDETRRHTGGGRVRLRSGR